MSSKIPKGIHLPTERKKTSIRTESKDTGIAAHKSDLKSQKENIHRKGHSPKVYKGVSTRFGQRAELEEQNQQLMTANQQLQSNLTEAQQRAAELELQFNELTKENTHVQKNLKDCHMLLVAAKIDPVLGGKVGEAARKSEGERKEALSVSSDLLNELKAFSDTASQQRAQLEEIQTMMSHLKDTRQRVMQERESFTQEAAEIEKALEEADALLL
ncbi:small kinetochore-associated protein [Cynoglossus semilaevis]|uniref:Uncharacterized LOC103381172 n=1 Tax=Cynoglossus semilaevis TaxID=244447 RepID=A0A3P8UY64_CYNSE|nr:uncharacterized protein LOC103381172 [Cynoglossus semilaevis]